MACLLVCMLAVAIGAETVLNAQDTSDFGELSFFDESIAVGRTDAANGFTPYQADGVSYARVVMGDGTTFYTFPSYYIMTKDANESGNPLFQYDFSSLNTAMETDTGTNPGWTKTNVYRLELPETMNRLNGGVQSFDGFSNMIELYMPANTTTVSSSVTCLFRDCSNLEIIHNIDSFLFKKGCLTDAFKNCAKLTSLTLCYSPDVVATGVNSFYGCTALTSVNFYEAFPNVTDIGKDCFRNCTSLTTISPSKQAYSFFLPENIKSTGENSFYGCTSFKYASIPATLTYLGPASFYSCTSLEFVDFNGNVNDVDFNNWGHFMNCTSLKAISLPDNTDIITNRILSGCTNLTAVYLPSATVTIESNGYGNASAFYNCRNMYFVDEPFEVRDENGNFLGDSFVAPERPDVYFMPSGLVNLFNRDTGVGFVQCRQINPVLVMPETLTRFWINDGVMYECGTSTVHKTVVFLGDMTDLRFCIRDARAVGVNYVFANPNDLSLSDVNVVDTSDRACYNMKNEMLYFCHSGISYAISQWGVHPEPSDTIATYLPTEGTVHYANPRENTVILPSCTEDGYTRIFCFCGCEMESVVDEGTALGHEFDTSKDAHIISCTYNNYFEVGVCSIQCARCEEHEESDLEALFEYIGFSYTEEALDGKQSMTQSFRVNRDAVAVYCSITGRAFDFGAVAAANKTPDLTNISPLSVDNGGNLVAESKVACMSMMNYTQPICHVKVVGITEARYESTVMFCLYVRDGSSVYYLNNGKTLGGVVGTTYKSLLPVQE